MGEVAGEGRTVLFVSHNIGAITALCSKAILLESGRAVEEGNAEEVVERYISSSINLTSLSLREREDRTGSGKARIVDISLIDQKGHSLREAMSGQKVGFLINYESVRDLRFARFKITIQNNLIPNRLRPFATVTSRPQHWSSALHNDIAIIKPTGAKAIHQFSDIALNKPPATGQFSSPLNGIPTRVHRHWLMFINRYEFNLLPFEDLPQNQTNALSDEVIANVGVKRCD